MTNKSDDSSGEFNFPVPSHGDSLNNDYSMDFRNIIYWIESFKFTRPKKFIFRDFSDASKVKLLPSVCSIN
ncbi:hypothetical protein ACI65C_006621 [Semiaphis heraclei]